jgi:hypothetical protein
MLSVAMLSVAMLSVAYAECCYAVLLCCVEMLSVKIKSIVLSVITLSVNMLCVVILSVGCTQPLSTRLRGQVCQYILTTICQKPFVNVNTSLLLARGFKVVSLFI